MRADCGHANRAAAQRLCDSVPGLRNGIQAGVRQAKRRHDVGLFEGHFFRRETMSILLGLAGWMLAAVLLVVLAVMWEKRKEAEEMTDCLWAALDRAEGESDSLAKNQSAPRNKQGRFVAKHKKGG